MADDTQEIIGTWTVKFMKWIWEYTFTPNGNVTWRDPLNNETGSGRWAVMGKFINLSWAESTTVESWTKPIKSTDQSGWYASSYGTGAFKANKKAPGQPAAPQGNQGRDVLPAGPNYTLQPDYVDNVVSGEYDPASGRFVAKHSDRSNIELDIQKILARAAIVPMPGASIVEMYVFYRKDGKIYPVVMDPNSTPNLVAMAREVEAALPGALALRQIGSGILDIVEWMLIKPNIQRIPGRKAWQAKPHGLSATNAELEAVNAIRAATPQFAKLSIEECLAIRAYTGEAWAGVNAALRGATNPTSVTNALAKSIISGLNKLPGFSGRLVRSESMAVTEAAARYTPGKTIISEGLLSTSRAGAVAQREGNIAIAIQSIGKNGKDISVLSAKAGKEFEVLFPPGTRFNVVKVQKVGQALIVELKEL
jgi:hypothetical protein